MKKDYDFLIVGAGITGIVLARELDAIGKKVLLIDKKDHIGGNCYDYADERTGILIQKYGPHIFHTKNEAVFNYLKRFCEFNDYKHKVIAFYDGEYYPIPINLETVNKFYLKQINSSEELKDFLEEKREKIVEIKNSEDVVVSKFGKELYEAFVKDYTKKQWDKYPSELDKSVLERLPIKYDKDPYYFPGQWQGMPIQGFTKMFENMLRNTGVEIMLETSFFQLDKDISYNFAIYTGPIDEFFNNKFGKLQYRSITFDLEYHDEDYQPNSVVNYPDKNVKFSRITEFKKFYELPDGETVIYRETFNWGGEPSYPLFDNTNKELLSKYLEEANSLKNVFFAGRLGRYKYLDMDKAVEEALDLFNKTLKSL